MGGTLYIGDLHGGNSYAAIKDFLLLLRKAKESGLKPSEIVVLGDFIDGIDKYPTQPYKQPVEVLSIEREFTKWLIEVLKNEFNPKRIVFVIGNHDQDFRGSPIDPELLTMAYGNVVFAREYIDENKMLCIHQIGRSTRIGGQAGWTPSAVDKAKSLVLDKVLREHKEIRGIVTAHCHKMLDILNSTGLWLILLPSFLKTGKETSEDIMYQPALLFMEGDKIEIISKRFSPLEEVTRFNDLLYAWLRNDRKRINTLDRALAIEKPEQKEEKADGSKATSILVTYSKKKYWVTPEQFEEIRRMLEKGYSPIQIARLLKINKDCVYGVKKMLGL